MLSWETDWWFPNTGGSQKHPVSDTQNLDTRSLLGALPHWVKENNPGQTQASALVEGGEKQQSSFKSERHLPWEIQESQPPVSARSPLRNSWVYNWYKIDSRPVDRDRQRWILCWAGTFADTPLDPVLIKASFAEQLGPLWEQPKLEESVTNYGCPIASKSLPRARHGQHLPLALAYSRLRHQSTIQREKPKGKIYTLLRQAPLDLSSLS